MIISAQNSRLKLIRLLMGRPKERREERAFVAEGVRLVEEALAADWPFRFVLIGETLSERGQGLVKKLENKGIEVEQVTDTLLNSISDTDASQGILAVLNQAPIPFPRQPTFVLILDTVRDPGNLGTLLRTAAAAGVQAILLPPETADAFAPKVVRSGMGAHFRLPLLALKWDEIHAHTKGMKIYLADMQGSPCWQADFRVPLALVIGGEAEGPSAAIRRLADGTICIPMPGKAESINAAVAGAVLMFEVVRQRSS